MLFQDYVPGRAAWIIASHRITWCWDLQGTCHSWHRLKNRFIHNYRVKPTRQHLLRFVVLLRSFYFSAAKFGDYGILEITCVLNLDFFFQKQFHFSCSCSWNSKCDLIHILCYKQLKLILKYRPFRSAFKLFKKKKSQRIPACIPHKASCGV